MTPVLVIAANLRDQIAREASAAFPRECCGLIEGVREGDAVRVTAVHPTRNLSQSADTFEIDPLEQFALLRAARERGSEIVGCYHSHPNGRGDPSPRDLEYAQEVGFFWLIAAVNADLTVAVEAHIRNSSGFAAISMLAE